MKSPPSDLRRFRKIYLGSVETQDFASLPNLAPFSLMPTAITPRWVALSTRIGFTFV